MKGDIPVDLHEREIRDRKTALLIDDDADRRDFLKTKLQSEGFEVRIHDRVFATPGLIRVLCPDLIVLATDMRGLSHERLQFIIDSNAQSKNIPMIFFPDMSAQASYMETAA